MQRFRHQSGRRRSATLADVTSFIERMRAVRESEERLTSFVESIEREHTGPVSAENQDDLSQGDGSVLMIGLRVW